MILGILAFIGQKIPTLNDVVTLGTLVVLIAGILIMAKL
jgi:hypothetical protein